MKILLSLIVAVFFGSALGIVDYLIEKKLRSKSFGIELVAKALIYISVWYMVGYIGYIGYLVGTLIKVEFVDSPLIKYTQLFAGNIFYAASIYTSVMIIVISFIKQMNTKFGPGILIPMLFGKFRRPRIEQRFFLFMDLKDSIAYAEKLGSLKFSQFIQDCFQDVNKVIPPFNAEIYQYVGDAVVLTWRSEEGLRKNNSIKFFFAFQKQLLLRNGY